MPLGPCRVMYVSMTDIQNGEPIYFTWNFSAPGLEVALCELTFYHQWHNVSAALEKTVRSQMGTPRRYPMGIITFANGVKSRLRPLGTELNSHAPEGRLQLSAKKNIWS